MLGRLAAMGAVTRCALELRVRGFSAACGAALASEPARVGEADRAWLQARWKELTGTGRLPWSTCLSRALALWRAARRRGLSGSLRLQVNRREPSLQAHAWIEFADLCLGGEGQAGARLVPLPRAAVTERPVSRRPSAAPRRRPGSNWGR